MGTSSSSASIEPKLRTDPAPDRLLSDAEQTAARLAIEVQLGDWDRSALTLASPEIITIAHPAHVPSKHSVLAAG